MVKKNHQAAIEAERKIVEGRKAVAVAQTTFEALKNCKEEVDNYQDVLERTKGYVWQQLERQ